MHERTSFESTARPHKELPSQESSQPSRRQFLLTASLASAAVLIQPSRPAGAETAIPAGPLSHRIDQGWHFHRGALSGVSEAWRTGPASQWEEVTLPHCFNALDACDPDHPYFRGQGWYRTSIQIENPFHNGRTLLHFQGAGQTTTVFVGETQVGRHVGGYDEFVVDITDAARKITGGLPITVVCDNSPDRDRPPSEQSDFCLYGGLYRHVNLVYTPQLCLERIHILPSLEADGSAILTVRGRLSNPRNLTAPLRIEIAILDPAGRTIETRSAQRAPWTDLEDLASLRIAKPQLWSPETPYLYRCRVALNGPSGRSILEERFGVRSIEFLPHGPFHLNGQRVLLRGTSRHADHAGLAAAMPDDLVRREFELIKAMGANFIRLAHYQQDRLVLDLCDELGIMVWEEAPWCRAGVGGEVFQQNVRAALTHLIDQHYNHPGIIVWGLGNEDDWPGEYPSMDQTAIRGFMTELKSLAHSLDNSRLTAFRRCDFARDIPDVYSPSIWAGWYSGDYHDYERRIIAEHERTPRLLHMEWGADSQAGRHAEDPYAAMLASARQHADASGRVEIRAPRDGDWSETYACDLIDWHLKTQQKLDWLAGTAQWAFKDFASPLRGENDVPHVNQKGLVERDLTTKEAFFVVQSWWSAKPMVHIYGHSWPERWGKPGELRDVRVYSNCAEVELFLNGKSVGTKKRDPESFPAAGLFWQIPFAEGTNHLHAVATNGTSRVEDQVHFQYNTAPWGKPAGFTLHESSQSATTTTVLVSLNDADGRRCLDSRNVIRFSLAGSGRLIDDMGTARASRQLELYNGRAEITVIRKGACTLGVRSEGLPDAFLNLT